MTPPIGLLIVICAVPVAGAVALTVGALYREQRPDGRSVWRPQAAPAFDRHCNTATVLTVLGILSAGMPAAIIFLLADALVSPLGIAPVRSMSDAAWPIAFMVSGLMPWAFPYSARWCYVSHPSYPLVIRDLLSVGACVGVGLAGTYGAAVFIALWR